MIYVMGEKAAGIVKIGTATNPVRRLRQLQTGYPRHLRLLLALPGGLDEETWLHARFAGLRVVSDREWFDFGDRDAVAEVIAALSTEVAHADDTPDAEGEGPSKTEPEFTCAAVQVTHWAPPRDFPTWRAHCEAHPGIVRTLGGSCDDRPDETEWPLCLDGGGDAAPGRFPRSVYLHAFYEFDEETGRTRPSRRFADSPMVRNAPRSGARPPLPSELDQEPHHTQCPCTGVSD